MRKAASKKTEIPAYWAICLILGLAFFLRIWGLSFGLPELYHADEPIVVNHALAYGTGDLNPHFFKIPPLVSYLLFGVYGLYFLFLKAFGYIESVSDFQMLFLGDPGSFYWLARFIFGALCGTATVYLLYRLVKKHFTVQHGLAAAFFLAAAFLHVRDSHYVYADIPLLFVLVACFFPILKALEKNDFTNAALFGVLFGTAVAVKYNGVFVFIPYVMASFWSKKKGIPVLNLAVAGLISLLSFAVLNPFSWLDAKSFFGELLGQSNAEGFAGLVHHLAYSLNGGVGVPLLVVGLSGLALVPARGDKKSGVMAVFVLIYYGVLCFFSQPYDRYVLPLIPFFVFFAADFLIESQKKLRLPMVFFWFLVVSASLPPLAKIALCDSLFMRQDVRALARERAEAVIPAGSKIALDVPFFMPRLLLSAAQLAEKENELIRNGETGSARFKRVKLMQERAERSGKPGYELYFLNKNPENEGFLFAKPAIPYSVARLKELGIKYVFTAKINPVFEPDFYRDLKREGVLMARFSPYKDESIEWPLDIQPLTGGPFLWEELLARFRSGQIIELYKLP